MDSMFYVKTKISDECEINTAKGENKMSTVEVKKSLKEIENTLSDVYCDIQSLRAAADNIRLMLKIANQQIGELEPEKSYIDVILEQKDDVALVPLVQVAIDYGFDDVCEIVSKLVDECGWDNVKLFCNKKDRLEIYYALKNKGILPLIEQEKSA